MVSDPGSVIFQDDEIQQLDQQRSLTPALSRDPPILAEIRVLLRLLTAGLQVGRSVSALAVCLLLACSLLLPSLPPFACCVETDCLPFLL